MQRQIGRVVVERGVGYRKDFVLQHQFFMSENFLLEPLNFLNSLSSPRSVCSWIFSSAHCPSVKSRLDRFPFSRLPSPVSCLPSSLPVPSTLASWKGFEAYCIFDRPRSLLAPHSPVESAPSPVRARLPRVPRRYRARHCGSRQSCGVRVCGMPLAYGRHL